MDTFNSAEETLNEHLAPTFSNEFNPMKLSLDCDAVAKTWPSASFVIAQDSAVGADSGSSKAASKVSVRENGTMENMDPADAKRARRKLANRESARRVRRKKEAQLTELETKVAQLRLKKATFLRRLTDITQKYNKADVDNRVLTANVEALEATVKMKEAEVIRVTGFHPAFFASPEILTMSMSLFNGSPSYTSTDVVVPMRDDLNQPLYQTVADNPIHMN